MFAAGSPTGQPQQAVTTSKLLLCKEMTTLYTRSFRISGRQFDQMKTCSSDFPILMVWMCPSSKRLLAALFDLKSAAGRPSATFLGYHVTISKCKIAEMQFVFLAIVH